MDDPIIKVSSVLEKIDMPYCLIGGYAVAAYGAPRYTAYLKPVARRTCGMWKTYYRTRKIWIWFI